jgi:4-aminobutyrate aminotransferase-like enzyme
MAAAGRYEQVVKISPPLTIEEELADAGVQVLIDSIEALR